MNDAVLPVEASPEDEPLALRALSTATSAPRLRALAAAPRSLIARWVTAVASWFYPASSSCRR